MDIEEACLDTKLEGLKCYICLEDVHDMPQICACQNMRVHTTCLQKYLNTKRWSDDPRCSICQQKFVGIKKMYTFKEFYTCTRYTTYFMAMSMFGTYIIILCSFIVFAANGNNNQYIVNFISNINADHIFPFLPLLLIASACCFVISFKLVSECYPRIEIMV